MCSLLGIPGRTPDLTGPVFLNQVSGLIVAQLRADGGLLSRHERRPRRGSAGPILPDKLLQDRLEEIPLSVRLVEVVATNTIAVAVDVKTDEKSDARNGETSDVVMIDVEKIAVATDVGMTVAMHHVMIVAMRHVMIVVSLVAGMTAVEMETATRWVVIAVIDAEGLMPDHCGAPAELALACANGPDLSSHVLRELRVCSVETARFPNIVTVAAVIRALDWSGAASLRAHVAIFSVS